MDNDDVRHFKIKGKHSHAPDVRVIGKKKVMNTIKNRAKTTTEAARNIVSDAMINVPNAVAATIAAPSHLVHSINRIRNDPNAPKNPKTLAELRFPEKYTKTHNNKEFILFDSSLLHEDDPSRIIMFGTEQNLDFLVQCQGLYMDGTFWIVPILFSQMYTIHGRYNGWHIPLVYVLTTDKSQRTYEEIFLQLKSMRPQMNPTDFTIDFEKAAMRAIVESFPDADIHGCNFHFGQNFWRHVQTVGLQSVYSSDADFALNIRLLLALAFVPIESVSDAFDELMTTEFYSEESESVHSEAIQNLVQYFQITYVYRIDRTGKRKYALFPPHVWNVYEQTLTGIVVKSDWIN